MAVKKKKLGPVKCPYCKQTFDRETTDYVKINSNRFAHRACVEQQESKKTKEELDLEVLQSYIKQLFKIDQLNARLNMQIKDYHTRLGYSYHGIYKSLTYFYEVKGNSIEKANGGIGIVPYVYDDAKNYYHAIWVAQQQNSAKPIEQYKTKVVEIHIPPPKKCPLKNTNFSFLENEDE